MNFKQAYELALAILQFETNIIRNGERESDALLPPYDNAQSHALELVQTHAVLREILENHGSKIHLNMSHDVLGISFEAVVDIRLTSADAKQPGAQLNEMLRVDQLSRADIEKKFAEYGFSEEQISRMIARMFG